MSPGRKTYDGTLAGGSTVDTEGGDPVSDKITVDEYVAPRKPKRVVKKLESNSNETLFSDDSEKDRYLLTYSDLITLLLGLFIILYAMSNIDIKKYQKFANAMGSIFGSQSQLINISNHSRLLNNKMNGIVPLKQSLQRMINQNGYGKSIKLIENKRGITIRILEDILFASGEAKLTPQSKTMLAKIANILKKLPNDIRIEGHTDDVPIDTKEYPSNWHLSVARATNTAYFLMHNEGINEDKVSIVGYAANKPIANNSTPQGRSQNRRVDIVILKKLKSHNYETKNKTIR